MISAHPGVAEVAVAGLPDEMKGEIAKAWIILRTGATVSSVEMKAYCRERLAPYKVPTEYEMVTELPKSQVGKVLRRMLRQQEMEKRGRIVQPA